MKGAIRSIARSSVYLMCSFSLLTATNPALAMSASPSQESQLEQAYSEQSFLTLINDARIEYGLTPLSLDSRLSQAAYAKALDMVKAGYWDHFRPSDSKAPWTFIEESGYSYQSAGENLARGYETPQGITRAWMASPSHRANVLGTDYKNMGLACVRVYRANGTSYLLTVQMFGSPLR